MPVAKQKPLKKACKCFSKVIEELTKNGATGVEFPALGTMIHLKSGGLSRVALVLDYIYFVTPKGKVVPKKKKGYLLANFCPLCGKSLEGKSL